jgi:hypothetical protein
MTVSTSMWISFQDPILFGCPEIPYALPPGRFENPVPLPSGFRYEDRDYITESSCRFNQSHVMQSLLTLTSGQTRYSPRATVKLQVCTDILEHLSQDTWATFKLNRWKV